VAETVDRLVDVADRVEAVRRAQQFQQPGLLAVGVLELVHQHPVELILQAAPDFRMFLQQPHGVFFQVVVIEPAGLPLALAVQAIEAREQLENRGALGGVIFGDQRVFQFGKQVVLQRLQQFVARGCRASTFAICR
jgi:hypothetical protein